MKPYKLKFNTAEMTLEDIRGEYDFSPPPDEVIAAQLKTHHDLHGVEFIGFEFNFSPDTYSIGFWDEKDDEKFREFVYSIEQDPMFGSYVGEYEEFKNDWEQDEYESSGSWHIAKKFVEVLEDLKEQSHITK